MLLKHERDRDKLERAVVARARKYSRGLNHLFLDPVKEVAQCDFGVCCTCRKLIVKIE